MNSNYLTSLITQRIMQPSEIESKISTYFFATSETVIVEKTITELSQEIGVSITSIYSYVKKLGFKGFQDFKIKVASNSLTNKRSDNLTILSDISSASTPLTITNKIIAYNIDLLQDLFSFIDEKTLDETLDVLYHAQSFSFFGQAASSVLAYDAYIKFLRLDYHCHYYMDFHVQLINATKLGEHDVAFIFSHSGNTQESIELAKVLHKNNTKIIAFTGNSNSELVTLGYINYILPTEETTFELEFITSRILYSTIVDIIFLSLLYQDEETNKMSIKEIRTTLDISKRKKNIHD